MRLFFAIVDKDENSAYGLTFPQLPGCFAASDTWEGIVPAATQAIDLWFADNIGAQPLEPSDVGRSPEVIKAACTERGIFIPYIPADTAVERINITLERSLLHAIDATAKARGMSRSSFLASAARRELVGAA